LNSVICRNIRVYLYPYYDNVTQFLNQKFEIFFLLYPLRNLSSVWIKDSISGLILIRSSWIPISNELLQLKWVPVTRYSSIESNFFISISLISKSQTAAFSSIRSRFALFGISIYPCCKPHRIRTCAAVFLYFFAMANNGGC